MVQPGRSKAAIWSWSLYDLANTAFSALFISVFFPLFIIEYLGGTEGHIGLVNGLAMATAAILVPFLGAMSDAVRIRKPFLALFTLICIVLTMLTGYAGLWMALVLGFLAILSYHAGLDMYDSLLPNVSRRDTMAWVSGIGTALGYVGTIASVGIAWLLIAQLGEIKSTIQLIFPVTGVFFALFAVPLFFFVHEGKRRLISFSQTVIEALSALRHTFMTVKKNRNLWLFLLASLLFMDGVSTTIIFFYLYAKVTLQYTLLQFFPLYMAMATTAALGALGAGRIADRVGHKKTLVWVLVGWLAVIALLVIKTTNTTYIIAGLVGGALLGSVWTIVRPILVRLAPKHKLAELFGFQGLTEKFGGVLGPIFFGGLVNLYVFKYGIEIGRPLGYKAGLVLLFGFFAVGLVILFFVRTKK